MDEGTAHAHAHNGPAGPAKDASFVLPYTGDLLDVQSQPARVSSGQRIKLQVEVNHDYKFLSIVDPISTLAELKNQLEIEYTELYPNEFPISIVRLQDSRRNDMPLRFKIGDLLKDKDKVYVVLKPILNPEDDTVDSATTTPRAQRGRKRKTDQKESKISQDTPNKKSALSPSQTPSQSPSSHLSTPMQQMSQITPYSPSAKAVPQSSAMQDRVVCNPYCNLIETRDSVPCTHCGELRPYVVPDNEKTDRNQCSKWCVTGSTRKLKAAGLEFCSICLARHRAGKYDLRKAHQCLSCHRPWLHLDEYMYCRTCRKSAMGSDKETPLASPMILSNSISILSGNGAPLHLPPQHIAPHTQPIPSHLTHQQQQQQTPSLLSRIHSSPPPAHITLHDIHKRPDLEKKGEPKGQSIPLQQLHNFQQQSQQHLLGVNSPHSSTSSLPPLSTKDLDGNKDQTPHDDHHNQDHHHPHSHPHSSHSHSQDDQHLAEMVLAQVAGETAMGNSYYDPTIPMANQEKVGS